MMMMVDRFGAICLLSFCICVFAPPPKRPEENKQPQHPSNTNDDQAMYNFAYSRYLEEVVKVLETDPKFQERLKIMPESDVKQGKIADHLDELGTMVRDQLSQAKMKEIDRLRKAIAKQIKEDGGPHNVKLPEHLDAGNWEKFEKEDLKMLIKKTVADMDDLDKQRKEKFKEHEMKEEAEKTHKLAQLDEEERKKAEQEYAESKKRHNEHEKLKHPGSRDQLEEVWEDSDQMDKENFDPKTFFALHDLNGDGYWAADELEALFQSELDKIYNETDPDDDPMERIEEMNRMREHVVSQMDKNNDRMISLEEFLKDSEAQAEGEDPGWEDLGDDDAPYTEEELKKFEQEYAQQKGWGNDAYMTKITTPSPQHNQPPQPAQQGQQQPPPEHQQQQPPAPVGHQEGAKVDPSYGV